MTQPDGKNILRRIFLGAALVLGAGAVVSAHGGADRSADGGTAEPGRIGFLTAAVFGFGVTLLGGAALGAASRQGTVDDLKKELFDARLGLRARDAVIRGFAAREDQPEEKAASPRTRIRDSVDDLVSAVEPRGKPPGSRKPN